MLATILAIWAPSMTAILGVVATIVYALGKTRDAFDKLNKDETLRELRDKLDVVIGENKELIRCNKLLIDELTKIRDYADHIKEG